MFILQDVAMLEKLIEDDVAAAKTPVLLVAFAGEFHKMPVDIRLTLSFQF